MKPWYALQVRGSYERRVESRLDQAALEHYSPFIPRPERYHSGKRHNLRPLERRETALLPGYVFARFDLDTSDRTRVISMPEVLRILGFGIDAVIVPDIEIESLQILISSKAAVKAISFVANGDYVRVIRGPMRGCEGYVSFVGERKEEVPLIHVLISGMGAAIQAQIEGDCLERCQAPGAKLIVMPKRSVEPVRIAA